MAAKHIAVGSSVRRPFATPPRISPGRVVRRAAIGIALLANGVLLLAAWHGLFFGPTPPDWLGLADAANRISAGLDPYLAQTYGFRWSPVAAWLFVPVVAAGLPVWQLLHLGALALLPKRAALLCVACFAFWVDLGMGNVLIFGFVLAYHALKGSKAGAVSFTAFALLIPRPLYIPVLIWLWWRHAENRRYLIAAGVVVAALTFATGYAWSWIEVLVRSSQDIVNTSNMAPSQIIGYWWVPFGAVASGYALWRGRVGLASLLASPYWLPYYFLMPLLDWSVQGSRTIVSRAAVDSLRGRDRARLGAT